MLKALLLVAAIAPSIAPAIALADGAPRQPVTVEIRDMKYAQDTLTVAVGTKVTWINRDQMPHTVTDRKRSFASAALDTGDSYTYTFTTPGEFTYFCALHPSMVARVVVR
jgi:plastocyanin